jgi:parallel beta-helix repeat protein
MPSAETVARYLLASVAGLLLLPAFAATRYVAPPPAGSDDHPGTLAEPWATLQHAAGQLAPGDELQVRAGRYAGFHLVTSGTAAERIVIRNFPGETPIVDADNPVTPDGINLESASHVTVEGFRVEGTTRAGIRAVLCEHVTLRGNESADNGRWGILTGFCDDLLIEHNTTSGSLDEHGIYVSNSGDRPVIRNNTIFGNNANGIHMNGDVSLGGDGIISEAVVENNVIFDNGAAGGSGINMDGVQDSIIRNNLVYATHASGVSLYRIDGGGASMNNRVLNNTVVVASDGRWALNIQDGSTGNQVFNNILLNLHGWRGSIDISGDSLAGFQSDYNIVMERFTLDDGDTRLTLAEWRNQTGQDMNSLVAAPGTVFADFGNGDYRRHGASPAVDAGTTLPDVGEDLLGAPRGIGAGYDIGAYEFGGIFADRFEAMP